MIADEITTLDATQLPGANGIRGIYVQSEKNRVVVEAGSAPAAMQQALTARYGPSKIAIQLTSEPFMEDVAILYGGGHLNLDNGRACTAAFTWGNGRGRYSLTAGHCTRLKTGLYDGDSWSVIDEATQDNWSDTRGSILHTSTLPPKKRRYSGDLAFIKIEPGHKVLPLAYGPNGKRYKVVGHATSYRARKGDRVCMGGRASGHSCGWVVAQSNKRSINGQGVWTYEVVEALKKKGRCSWSGDSGGPVCTQTNSGVWARGVIFASNKKSGYNDRKTTFTNIADARWLQGGGNPLIAK